MAAIWVKKVYLLHHPLQQIKKNFEAKFKHNIAHVLV